MFRTIRLFSTTARRANSIVRVRVEGNDHWVRCVVSVNEIPLGLGDLPDDVDYITIPKSAKCESRGHVYSVSTERFPLILYPAVNGMSIGFMTDAHIKRWSLHALSGLLIASSLCAFSPSYLGVSCAVMVGWYPTHMVTLYKRRRKIDYESTLTKEERAVVDDVYWQHCPKIWRKVSDMIVKFSPTRERFMRLADKLRSFYYLDDEGRSLRFTYYPSGRKHMELWYLGDKLHRDDGEPALIERTELGEIIREEWWVRGEQVSRT